MGFWQKIFGTKTLPTTAGAAEVKAQAEEAKIKLVSDVNALLADLPNLALIAVAVRAARRLQPVLENAAPGSQELSWYTHYIQVAEHKSGLSAMPPDEIKFDAPRANLKVWYSSMFTLVSLPLQQAVLYLEMEDSTEKPRRAKILEVTSNSIVKAIELSCAIYGKDESTLQSVFRALRLDCDVLRNKAADMNLSESSAIEFDSAWVADLWLGSP